MLIGISALVIVIVGALATVALLRALRDDPPAPAEPTVADATLAPDTQSPSEAPASGPTLPASGPDTPPPGVDAELDDLWRACANEDWAACDDLYFRSDVDSDYEFFGETCGHRALDAGFCESAFGEVVPTPSPTRAPEAGAPEAEGGPPEEDAALDDLWSACQDEDWVACDRLYFESEPDSDYEFFGATCGARDLLTGGSDLCQNLHAAGGAPPVVLPGDLEVGTCFDEPGVDEVVYWIPTVPCDEPHDVEIIGLLEMTRAEYPADMAAVADRRCRSVFADFVGLAYAESVLDVYHLSPTRESWELGDRGIACGVYDPAGPVEGTLEGAAR